MAQVGSDGLRSSPGTITAAARGSVHTCNGACQDHQPPTARNPKHEPSHTACAMRIAHAQQHQQKGDAKQMIMAAMEIATQPPKQAQNIASSGDAGCRPISGAARSDRARSRRSRNSCMLPLSPSAPLYPRPRPSIGRPYSLTSKARYPCRAALLVTQPLHLPIVPVRRVLRTRGVRTLPSLPSHRGLRAHQSPRLLIRIVVDKYG